MYHIGRGVKELPDKKIDHPDNIVIVNGSYQKEDPIGLLMRDFHNCNVSSVNNMALKNRLSYFKESKEGRDNMSEYIQRVYKEDFDKLKIDTTLDCAMAIATSQNSTIIKIIEDMNLDDELKEKVLAELARRGID